MTEKIRLDVCTPVGTCATCRKEPLGPALQMTVRLHDDPYEVTLCRDCLSEHAPESLAALERGTDRLGFEVRDVSQ